MPLFYFVGQTSFGNRGCEALIRSNVKTIRSIYPTAEFLVPSLRPDLDAAQWPDAQNLGVRFVSAEPLSPRVRWWGRARRRLKFLEGHPPPVRLTPETLDAIRQSDALLMTGGDNISLDYDLESLYFWTGICESAITMGKPVVLWAGSVGPFSSVPSAERRMKKFLAKLPLITVRETPSFDYLKSLGLANVEQVADPAFVLDFEPAPETITARFNRDRPVLGFNISPLILKFRTSDADRDALENEVTGFLHDLVTQGKMDVLLVPHVDPLDGSTDNSDWSYMSNLLAKLRHSGSPSDHIDILPRHLNAAQLKDVIRRCTYFMAARTHATVAAMSQGVPTTSIAYSIKAKGINYDLFGHTRYVLDTPQVSRSTLHEHLVLLQAEEDSIRTSLSERIPTWQKKAHRSAQLLEKLMRSEQS